MSTPRYRLTIASWENDADRPRTVMLDNLTHAETTLLVGVLGKLKSKNRGPGFLGNYYDPNPSERSLIYAGLAQAILAHPSDGTRYSDLAKAAADPNSDRFEDEIHDFLEETGMLGDEEEGFFTRVMESLKVEINGIKEDVTPQFL